MINVAIEFRHSCLNVFIRGLSQAATFLRKIDVASFIQLCSTVPYLHRQYSVTAGLSWNVTYVEWLSSHVALPIFDIFG